MTHTLGVIKFTILEDPSLVIISLHWWSKQCTWVEFVLKVMHKFHDFYRKNYQPLRLGIISFKIIEIVTSNRFLHLKKNN